MEQVAHICLHRDQPQLDSRSDAYIEQAQELVINEMVEFIIPLSYLLCFLTAYFGPNSSLIGNVLNGLWQYAAVDGIGKTVETIGIFFIIDCLSGLSCFFILKIYANINILKALSYLQKEFGMVFAINIACPLNAVSSIDFLSKQYHKLKFGQIFNRIIE